MLTNSVAVKWEAVPNPIRGEELRGYKVVYTFVDESVEQHTEFTRKPEFVLKGLRANTRIRIDITAVSSNGMEGTERTFVRTTSELEL